MKRWFALFFGMINPRCGLPSVTFLLFFAVGCTGYDNSKNDLPFSKKSDDQRLIGAAGDKVELGRLLFFDTRLSVNGTKSCASCHNPAFAFSDGYRTSITSLGDNLQHNAPSLINVRFLRVLDWANSDQTSLERQLKRPLYNKHPVELGFNVNLRRNIALLEKDSLYKRLLLSGFPGSNGRFDSAIVEAAIVSFVKTLVSFNSPYDHYIRGDSQALSSSAKAGMHLFFSAKLNCNSCHPPPTFTLNNVEKNTPADSLYFNTGIYNVLNRGNYANNDQGIYQLTHKQGDIGKFKIPSLRNLAFTSPYMHDGSIAGIGEVIDNYSRGGQLITTGPWKGDGKTNPYKSSLITGFSLDPKEKKQLIDFLYSLGDSSVLNNPAFLKP